MLRHSVGTVLLALRVRSLTAVLLGFLARFRSSVPGGSWRLARFGGTGCSSGLAHSPCTALGFGVRWHPTVLVTGEGSIFSYGTLIANGSLLLHGAVQEMGSILVYGALWLTGSILDFGAFRGWRLHSGCTGDEARSAWFAPTLLGSWGSLFTARSVLTVRSY